jgi:hypothetical protein
METSRSISNQQPLKQCEETGGLFYWHLWQIVPSALVLIAILTAFSAIPTIDYLTWRQFHRVDAFERRLETIDQATDKFPAEKVVSMFKQVMQEKKDFQKQY